MSTNPTLMQNLARATDAERLAHASRRHPTVSTARRQTARERTGWALIQAGSRLLLADARANNRVTAGH